MAGVSLQKGINMQNWCDKANEDLLEVKGGRMKKALSPLLQNNGLEGLWGTTADINTNGYLFHWLKVEEGLMDDI